MSTCISSLRVLIVDDEESVADSISAILTKRHCQVRTAYDAWRAMRLAAEFEPQALICDLMLPGMGGVDLAIYVRERHPQCKVLLISGKNGNSPELERAMRLGHLFNVLPKPLMPKQLLAFVESCGETDCK